MSPNGYPDEFSHYEKEYGFPSDIILNIQNDNIGQLWLNTENDLIRFSPEKESFETFTKVGKLLKNNIFQEASSIIFNNKENIIGYQNGIIRFQLETITPNLFQPYLSLSNFKILNKPVLNSSNAYNSCDVSWKCR